MLGVVLDVSERKRAGEQLRQALAELTESHEELKATQLRLIQAAKMDSIGRLAAGVAHEVKNPLAIAIMGLEYLSSSVHGKDPNVRMALKDVQKAINRADLVIRGLLDFSAPTKLDLKLEDLNPIVGRTLSLIRHELGKQHIKLAKRLAEDLPRLELDANKIEQVFVNICMNSVQAMTGGGTLSITTSLSREDARGPVVVAQVQDTGPGIPKNKLARVFDPFFTTKGQGKGTGLGLTVAKQIVELHGGTIHVNNRAEGGFRVSISFPTPRRKEHDEG